MAKPAPNLNIEPSTATVDVRIIDTTSWIANVNIRDLLQPAIPGYEKFAAPSYSFLIEHAPSGRKLLYDLGVRQDWQNLSPHTVAMIKTLDATIAQDHAGGVREQLEAHGVPGSSIEAVIWSHWHFDHTGDPSTFDPTTALIVGPGFKDAFLPGYPAGKDSPILEADYAGRELRELDFSSGGGENIKQVGRFRALDYFGDGSFFILDSPGHAVGHLCALARVTPDPDPSYIFMGGDASHHGGEFRPSAYLPLPETVSGLPKPLPSMCPGELFAKLLQKKEGESGDRTKPFLRVRQGEVYLDAAEAERTVEKMQEADAHDAVLVVIAHDADLLEVMDFFPKYANGFKDKKWVEKGRWAFLKDFKEAVM